MVAQTTSSLHHINEPQKLALLHVECFGSEMSSLCGTKQHQGWVGFDPHCGLVSVTDHICSITAAFLSCSTSLLYFHISCFASVTTPLCGTKAHQGWTGFKPSCYFSPFKNHTKAARMCLSPRQRCLVKKPLGTAPRRSRFK